MIQGPDVVNLEVNINGSKSTLRLEDEEFENVGFTNVQMSKLKKSKAFTREGGREIGQPCLRLHRCSAAGAVSTPASLYIDDQSSLTTSSSHHRFLPTSARLSRHPTHYQHVIH